ncbi:MAG: NACHT domain-containing protein [Cyanobacteria bacterium J06632_22]
MAKRSLKASSSGIAIAKRSFQRTGWTQEYLAGEVGLETRQSIWKFFSGRPVERHIFIDICFRLDLEWQDIAEPPEVDPLPAKTTSGKQLTDWVTQLRAASQSQIMASCDPLQSPLPLPQPRTLTQSYVPAEALSHLSAQRWLSIDELSTHTANTLLLPPDLKRLDAHTIATQNSHIVVTGRLGIGKTTFLKHLALDCIAGRFRPDCVPIFLSLQQIQAQLPNMSCLSELVQRALPQTADLQTRLDTLLSEGRILLLLDGIDEISESAKAALFDQVRACFQRFPKLPIILSHRTASNYACLPGFRYLELAAFSDEQILSFAQRWYSPEDGKETAPGQGLTLEAFQNAIFQADNQSLLDLARTPLLLTVICAIFQQRNTLPQQTSRLFRICWDLLQEGWDRSRGIVRNPHGFSPHTKTEKSVLLNILSQLAALATDQSCYFFSRRTLLQTIAQYLIESGTVTASPQKLYEQSEALLEMILTDTGLLIHQAQDIYSLPTAGFYTYLTEQKLAVYKLLPAGKAFKALTRSLESSDWPRPALARLGLAPAPQIAAQ